jgi:hypothetical protein
LSNSRFQRKQYPANDEGSTTGQPRSRTRAGKSLSKFHPARINRLHVSQKAAALLFDLATVDIR